MAAKAREPKNAARQVATRENGSVVEGTDSKKSRESLVSEHLPPLHLVFICLFCSLGLLVFALRDFLVTGRVIGGAWDEAMLVGPYMFNCMLV